MAKGQSASATMVNEIAEGKENPFWTIEALQEHIGECWRQLAKTGVEVWDKSGPTLQRPKGKPDTMTYSLSAVDMYASKLFQYMAALEPDIRAASEGDKEALKRVQQRLAIIAARHQKEWEEIG